MTDRTAAGRSTPLLVVPPCWIRPGDSDAEDDPIRANGNWSGPVLIEN